METIFDTILSTIITLILGGTIGVLINERIKIRQKNKNAVNVKLLSVLRPIILKIKNGTFSISDIDSVFQDPEQFYLLPPLIEAEYRDKKDSHEINYLVFLIICFYNITAKESGYYLHNAPNMSNDLPAHYVYYKGYLMYRGDIILHWLIFVANTIIELVSGLYIAILIAILSISSDSREVYFTLSNQGWGDVIGVIVIQTLLFLISGICSEQFKIETRKRIFATLGHVDKWRFIKNYVYIFFYSVLLALVTVVVFGHVENIYSLLDLLKLLFTTK